MDIKNYRKTFISNKGGSMKTPKEFMKNINNKIITDDMLEAALFSLNKRAKNMRDMQRKYAHKYDKYNNEGKYKSQKENYYKKQEFLLRLLTPVCAHIETVPHGRTEKKLYYLFYRLGKHSFHRPIPSHTLETKYPDLEIKTVDLDTYGEDINDLISNQFIDKLIYIIKKGDYQYVRND